MERGIRARVYFFAFVISALLFTVGLLVGWHAGMQAVSGMQRNFDRLRADEYSLEVLELSDYGNMSQYSCAVYEQQFGRFIYGTEQFGAQLEELERAKGKSDAEVMAIKSSYASMQLRNYLLQQRMDTRCGMQHSVVLYFYSNLDYAPETDEGKQLEIVAGEFPLYIYHFDVDVDNPAVEALKQVHEVGVTPTLVVGGRRYEGFKTAEEIRQILDAEN